MYPVKRTLASGKHKYYIRYRDENGKLHYLDKNSYPPFYSKKDCQEWINKHRHEFLHIRSILETWVTLYTGDIGNTFLLKGSSTGSTRLFFSSKYPKS